MGSSASIPITAGAGLALLTIGVLADVVGGMGAGPSGPRDNWALLGGIVETPQGPWFFKMTGPGATVTAARGAFEALIDSAAW